MAQADWIEHAYPLQQLTIRLQGTRNSDKEAIISLLETVLVQLKAGVVVGQDFRDDFGYAFKYVQESEGPSFFSVHDANRDEYRAAVIARISDAVQQMRLEFLGEKDGRDLFIHEVRDQDNNVVKNILIQDESSKAYEAMEQMGQVALREIRRVHDTITAKNTKHAKRRSRLSRSRQGLGFWARLNAYFDRKRLERLRRKVISVRDEYLDYSDSKYEQIYREICEAVDKTRAEVDEMIKQKSRKGD